MKRHLTRLLSLVVLLCCHASTSLAITQEISDAWTYKMKGDAYYQAHRYSEALESYTKGLEEAQRHDEKKVEIACLGNIGNVYSNIEDFTHSIHYYICGYEEAEKIGDNDLQSRFLINIVAAYCKKGDAKNARTFFKQQMRIPAQDSQINQYYAFSNQGLIAEAEKDYKMADFYHGEALRFAQAAGMEPPFVISQYIELGNILLAQNKAAESIRYYILADSLARAAGTPEYFVDPYRKLAKAYEMLGDTLNASKYNRRYMSLSDSIFNQAQFNVAGGKLFEYENRVNKERIDHLISTNHRQWAAIAITVVLALGVFLFAWMIRRQNKRLLEAQRLLVNKNQELMRQDAESRALREQYVATLGAAGSAMEPDSEPGTESRATLMSPEQANLLLSRISDVMEDVQVISRSDFSLSTLAEMTGSNTKYVSYVINEHYGKNFKTYLNEYRIREACRRLSDTEKYGNMTLQAIYEELGYNSAAGFIKAFKNVNGMTPSQYQKLVRSEGDDG